MSAVVIRLVGGLGNQMFQYAAARAVALRSGADLVFDLSWFSTVSDRGYALAPFAIDALILSDSTVLPASKAQVYWRRLIHALVRETRMKRCGHPVFTERHFHFDPAVLDIRAPAYLDGFFQSERYFADCADVIAAELRLVDPPTSRAKQLLQEIKASDAVCLHVRRGDYVANATTSAYHGTLSIDYYRKGLRIVGAGLSRPHCFIFSDDPAWVRANFRLFFPTTIVDIHGPDEVHEDMRLMAACNHFVIANSSLSWWAAWLGTDPAKTVVAPEQWFQSSPNDTKDLIPERWTRI